MEEPIYELAWPRELFEREAGLILALPEVTATNAVIPLIEEAYGDPIVWALARRQTGTGSWTPTATVGAVQWLQELLADDTRLQPHVRPAYWAERNGQVAPSASRPPDALAKDYLEILISLQNRGYFPRALPRECPSKRTDYDEVVNLIEKATRLRMSWPISPSQLTPGELYSLIEYFHDNAQRPRTYKEHTFDGCGSHYGDHNREIGGMVYRWRLNELLAEYGVDLRLAAAGSEKGRLVRHFDSPLDDLADAEVAKRGHDELDEVAHAIRDYRERAASLPQKRAALALLAGALEPRREAIRAAITKADESDLFQIANAFAIRHRNAHQRMEYDEVFLDWIFWNYLSMVGLMEALESRMAISPST